jgi:hypothetical protein
LNSLKALFELSVFLLLLRPLKDIVRLNDKLPVYLASKCNVITPWKQELDGPFLLGKSSISEQSILVTMEDEIAHLNLLNTSLNNCSVNIGHAAAVNLETPSA